jgi:hypothetical protein
VNKREAEEPVRPFSGFVPESGVTTEVSEAQVALEPL